MQKLGSPAITDAMSEIGSAARSYLLHVLRETGLSPSALAKRAKLSTTTLTRPLNDPSHKSTMSLKTIEKIAQVVDIDPAPFLTVGNAILVNNAVRSNRNNDRTLKPELVRNLSVNSSLPCVAEVRAGYWREVNFDPLKNNEPLFLTCHFVRPELQFCVLIADESVNRHCPLGGFAVIFTSDDRGRALAQEFGDVDEGLALIERKSADRELTETTIRRVSRVDGGWLLAFESSDPRFGPSITTTELPTADITVVGRVMAFVTLPT